MARLPHALVAPLGAGTLISGVTPPGFATFVLSMEPGTKATFSWKTNVVTSYSGSEQRESSRSIPRLSVSGVAFLLDGPDRDIKATLQRAAAKGKTFGLALPFEEAIVTADSTSNTVDVGPTSQLDWALVGGRIVALEGNGAVTGAVIQSVGATTLTLAVTDSIGASSTDSLGTARRAGTRVMPVVPVLLEPQQGFARYPVGVDLWSIQATSNAYGFAGVDAMGVGAQLSVYGVVGTVAATDLLAGDLMIWDRVNAIEGTASEAMQSRTEIVDLGGVPFAMGGSDVPDWQRSLKLASTSSSDWQWFKALIHRLRGQQGAFLLSTNRDDLVYVATVSGGITGIKVKSTTLGGDDVIGWFVSPAHRRLAVIGGGVVQYVTENLAIDNGDGTVTLGLDKAVTGTVTRVSFLEQVRLMTDDVEVTFDGGAFAVDLSALTVQEVITTPTRFVFDASFDAFFPGFPLGAKLPVGPLGNTTLVLWKGQAAFDVVGIKNSLPAGNVDGMVVCFFDLDGHGYLATHNDSLAGTDGFLLSGSAGAGGVRCALWFRYHGTLQRWVNFMRNQ